MAISNIHAGFPTVLPEPRLAPTPAPARRSVRRGRSDGRLLSSEVKAQILTERRLKERLRSVLQAQSSGLSDGGARQALAQEYASAKQAGVPLATGLEGAVKKALGPKGVSAARKMAAGKAPNSSLMRGLQNNFGGGAGRGAGGGSLGGLGGGGGSLGGGGGGGLGSLGGGGGGGGNLGATDLNSSGGFGGGGGTQHPAKPLSEQDHQNVAEAVKKDDFGDLIGGWRQTREGNCASVATIKAAMKEYGGNVFDKVERNDSGYQIQLKDGRSLSLSNEEFALARGQAQFAGNDPQSLAYGELCYGVIAKQHALNNNVSLMASCFDLNNGFDPRDAARALGLGNQMTAFNGHDGAVWNASHAVFQTENVSDMWGSAGRPLPANWGYSLKHEMRDLPSERYLIRGQQGGDGTEPSGQETGEGGESPQAGGPEGVAEPETQEPPCGDQAAPQADPPPTVES